MHGIKLTSTIHTLRTKSSLKSLNITEVLQQKCTHSYGKIFGSKNKILALKLFKSMKITMNTGKKPRKKQPREKE